MWNAISKPNEQNMPIQEKDPMGNLKTYQYYASYDRRAGMIQKKTRPSGITATYDYNANNDQSRVTYRNPATGTLDQPFQYKGAFGYYTDKETGLIYLQQRYYSPKLMRFLSQDPLNCNCEGEIMSKLMQPLDLNPYAYVMGNPVMYLDVTGEGTYQMGAGSYVSVTWISNCKVKYAIHLTRGLLERYGAAIGSSQWTKKGYPRVIATVLNAFINTGIENLKETGANVYHRRGVIGMPWCFEMVNGDAR